MHELSDANPTARFTGLADLYARCRPDYPAGAVRHTLSRCGLVPGALLVDVGCGTGISTRLFARQGLRVIGIEPNADMRARAAAEPAEGLQISYRDGRAEATGFADATADAVLAAQSFHWFEPGAALGEFHRILRPGGWVVLLWNERDETDAFTAAYGAVVSGSPEAAATEGPRRQAGTALLHSSLFADARRDTFQHQQALTEEAMLGRAFSTSYAPREPARAARYEADLRAVFARYAQDGKVLLRYETSLYTAQRAVEQQD